MPATLDPTQGGVVRLTLTRRVPPEELPAEMEHVRIVKLRSERLSRFHGRPMYLRAGIVLPVGHGRDPGRRYPLRVHIGGYGTRYLAVREMMSPMSDFRRAWLDEDTPRMILLHLDGAGPFGDPYQVNSANNGPCGQALIEELIPAIEKRFRAIARPGARFVTGHSSGGWSSLWLQVTYPDFFGGVWSTAPDPVDFRDFQRINVYRRGENMFVDAEGNRRPIARGRGVPTLWYKGFSDMEEVMGHGGQLASFEAVFSERGPNGQPLARARQQLP